MDWVPGSHASTFGGNPVCIAAALATLDVIEKENLLQNSAEVGAYMFQNLAKALKTLLTKADRVLDNPPYNLVIHSSPVQDSTNDHYHWHIEFM